MNIATVQSDSINKIYQNTVKIKSDQILDTDEISDVYSESDSMSKFKEIASKYDVNNMSENEMTKMGQELYKEGLISLKDMAIMTFSVSKAIQDIENVTGSNNASISGFRNTNPNQKNDYLQVWKNKRDYDEKYGNDPNNQKINDGIIGILEKLSYLRNA